MLCISHFYCCYLYMYMSSTYYLSICVLCAHYLQWSLIYSFLIDNADVIHMSSLVLFIYPIMYNLVLHIVCTNAHCPCHLHVVHTCTHHLLVIFTTPHIPYYPQLSFCTLYCLEMHMLCTCHLYCCYLYMYMSSTYYLGIYVLCAHYLQWSLICFFLTDNINVIHTSSLVLFIIYSIMENMSSTPLPDDMSSAPFPDDVSSAPLPDDMSSTLLPDDVSSTPLPDDMSSALQRNMSYLQFGFQIIISSLNNTNILTISA